MTSGHLKCGAILAIAFLLAGCQLYWTKPGADLAAFTADHRDCATKAGVPMDGDRMLVSESLYKACLKALGWRRETGSSHDGAPGLYRGLEEDAVASLAAPPPQIGSSGRVLPTGLPAASSSRVLQCRRDWIERWDWRQRLEEYRECLAR
jgi:hypothetical protein